LSLTDASGTWCARNVPSMGIPSTSFGQVHPLGVRKDDHGPDGLLLESVLASLLLNSTNLGITILKRLSEELMHDLGIVALNKVGLVTSTHIEGLQVGVARASLSGWPGDFVSIEMKDRQHRAVSHRIDEVDRLPASFQWAGLGLAIPDTQATIRSGLSKAAPNA
jgi:hypothetical protein